LSDATSDQAIKNNAPGWKNVPCALAQPDGLGQDDEHDQDGGPMHDNFGNEPGKDLGKDIGKKAGLFLMGAAALSLLFPRRRRNGAEAPQTAHAPQTGQSAASALAAARPQPARAPKRMWALVQFSPEVIVLAVSPSRAELERELAELNETWNHWELRTERQRYAIQAAPVLYALQEPAPARPIGSTATG
jgi:hypothetical protein